jgi:hypothetical protein
VLLDVAVRPEVEGFEHRVAVLFAEHIAGRTSHSKLSHAGESGWPVMGFSRRCDRRRFPQQQPHRSKHLPGHVAPNLPAPKERQASRITSGSCSTQITHYEPCSYIGYIAPSGGRIVNQRSKCSFCALVTSRPVPSLCEPNGGSALGVRLRWRGRRAPSFEDPQRCASRSGVVPSVFGLALPATNSR